MMGTDVARALDLLLAGQLVAIPTETVYGLAGNALNEAAVAEIFAVKRRPFFDPLIVHFATWDQALEYLGPVPPEARLLAQAFMPGPLTLLLPRTTTIPDLVTAGSPLMGLRIPAHPLTQQLLQQLPFPLAAPSANPFGYISPTTAAHVAAQLGDQVPYILDGGPASVGIESTIVGFPAGHPTIYRQGGIPTEALARVVGTLVQRPHSSSKPSAPGMLASHYAPRIPLRVGDLPSLIAETDPQQVGILAFRKSQPAVPLAQQVILAPDGDLRQAARRLFAGLRHLDALPITTILAEWVPEHDLGLAINDRLRRAAAKTEP